MIQPLLMYIITVKGVQADGGWFTLSDWVHWECKVNQLEKQHSNGPRSVSPRGMLQDLVINIDLPVEQAMERDQI